MTSIYVADLDPSVDESVLFKKFSYFGPIASIRICRDKSTKMSLGHAYVNFQRKSDAEKALDTANFDIINGRRIRLMWIRSSSNFHKPQEGNIFVKNLSSDINIKVFRELFLNFGTIVSCKIALDSMGNSKGYGYVQFEKEESAINAINKINGMVINGKEVYVGKFVPRAKRMKELKPNNIYIKNLPDNFENAIHLLTELFESYGSIISYKLIVDDDKNYKGFGFVSFKETQDAIRAIEELNGLILADGKRLYVAPAQKKTERQEMLKQRYEQFKKERAQTFHGRNLYVKNLEQTVDDECLLREFSAYGTVLSAKVFMEGTRSKGFGFVCFSTIEEAANAIAEMNGRFIKTKPIYVCLAQTKEERKAYLEEKFLRKRGESMVNKYDRENVGFHCQFDSTREASNLQGTLDTFKNPCSSKDYTIKELCETQNIINQSLLNSNSERFKCCDEMVSTFDATVPSQEEEKINQSAKRVSVYGNTEYTVFSHIQQVKTDEQPCRPSLNQDEKNHHVLDILVDTQLRNTERRETAASGTCDVSINNQLPHAQADEVIQSLFSLIREMYPKAADKIISFLNETTINISELLCLTNNKKEMERKIVKLVTLIEIHEYLSFNKSKSYSEALKEELLQKLNTKIA